MNLNKIEPLPIGTLLLPNSYQFQRGDPVSGLILGVMIDKEFCFVRYRVHLSNGNTTLLNSDVIRDLFDPVQSSEVG